MLFLQPLQARCVDQLRGFARAAKQDAAFLEVSRIAAIRNAIVAASNPDGFGQ
jgi:hypothetical protein